MVLALWNSFAEPVEIAFEPPSFKNPSIVLTNWIINIIFALDIMLNFRTTYKNEITGEEVIEPRKICRNYLRGTFWIDFISVVPFDIILSDFVSNGTILKAFSILKLFRVFRLSKLITYMNSTDDVKHSLKIIKLCFFLVLYIHISGCIWVYINHFNIDEEKWIPLEFKADGGT